MTKQILKKLIIIFFIITILMNYLLSLKVYANVEIGDNTHLYGEKDCVSILEIKSTGRLKQVIKVYYHDPDTGKKLYAFCIEPSKPGVGTGATDFSGYETYIREKMQDQRIWRALYHGYIGVNWQNTTVECDDDWYYVTKTVIHCLVNNERPSDAYRVPTRIATSDTAYATLADVQRRGQKALNECDKLYDYAINGTENYREATVNIEKVGEFVSDGNNIVQTLKIVGNKELGAYNVKLTNFPNGTTYNKNGNIVKIIIPKSNIVRDINGIINISDAEVKTCPAFYGKSYNDGWQDYVTAADPYEKANTSINITLNTNNGIIKIVKEDAETKELIPDTTLKIEKDGELIKTVTTKENEETIIDGLYPGTYKITEVKANENYVLPENATQEVNVKYGETTTVKFSNTHKKGNLKIYKVDLDNENLPVEDVEFEITDQDGYKYKATTNEEGIAYIENIRSGISTIKEIKTNKIYKSNNETYSAEVKWNETAEIKIKNEKLKGQIEVYKVDAENEEIKLEGVEFQVINSDNKIIETIKTNKDGYAITARIPIGEYKLKEVSTDEMHILNDEIVKVNVTTDIVSRLDITNERIKGQIKIVKTSEDYSFINEKIAGTPIKDVKFEVYNSNKELVDTIITDNDGIAITKKLDKGSYTIKEVEAGKWYLLNENEFTTEIKTHGEIVQVDITNESEKPNVDIEKTGIIQTTANQEIRYDFKINNTGNVPLDNFTWFDYLPTEYVKMSKLITGTYNQDLNYNIYYKTNLNDYKILAENLNTQVNNYIDFASLELEEGEVITEFKVEFGTVQVGFESVINPYIFVTVNNNVKNEDTFTNKTRIEGYNDEYVVWDEDEHTTKVYEKEIIVKKLPRTGY